MAAVAATVAVEGNNLEASDPIFGLIDPDNHSDDAHGDAVAGAQRSFVQNTRKLGEVGPNEMETEYVEIGGKQFLRDEVTALDEALARENVAVEDSDLGEASMDAKADSDADSDEDLISPKSPPPQVAKRTRGREDRRSGYGANGSDARGPSRFKNSRLPADRPYQYDPRFSGPIHSRSNGPGPRRHNDPRAPGSSYDRPNGPGPRRQNNLRATGSSRREPYPQSASSPLFGSHGSGPSGRERNQNRSPPADVSRSRREEQPQDKMDAMLTAIANEAGLDVVQSIEPKDPRRRRKPMRQ